MLTLNDEQEQVVKIALRVTALDATMDMFGMRGEDIDGWSDAAADLYRELYGEHEGAFDLTAIANGDNAPANT